MANTFDDSGYFEKVFSIKERNIDSINYKKIKTAFKLAHDVRKFEIELFWKRGTYFWAFILASFTAYFVTFDKILGKECFSLCTIIRFSPTAKIALFIIVCLCFIFCYSWVLINKGSKFWQKNWEAHIDEMEDIFSGKLYKTFLNTRTDEFNNSVLNKKAYDYSVTQITTVTSIILMVISACLCIFHFVLFVMDFWKYLFIHNMAFEVISLLIAFLILFLFGFAASEIKKCVGNPDKEEYEKKWRQRK